MKSLVLVSLLAAPAAAQNLRPTLALPGAPTVRVTPVLPSAPVSPSLATPLLPSLTPAPVLPPAAVHILQPAAALAASAQAAPEQAVAAVTLKAVVSAAQPALDALKTPSVSGAAAHAAGLTLEDALTGRRSAGAVSASPVAPSASALPSARSAPAVSGVTYASAVSARHRAVLAESLRRRKAGWFRGLARMGVALAGPVAPTLKVLEAKDLSSKTAAVVTGVAFTVQWTQGPARAGAFRVVVPVKDPEPELTRLADPAVPEARQLVLRMKSRVMDASGPVPVERAVTDAEVRAFLAAQGLRVVSRSYDGVWTAAVPGGQRAATVARRLSGRGLVLSAAPKTASFPEADQLLVAFKRRAVLEAVSARVETEVGDEAVAAALAGRGLTVLERTRDGLWRVGAPKGKAAKLLAALESDAVVLYARPLSMDVPEAKQTVLTLREGTDDEALAALLRRHGLTVLTALGERVYKVGGDAAAAALASDASIASAVAVGSLPDEAVEASARGTASHKGRPWSQTEYNLVWSMGYDGLVKAGATQAQMARYEKLCADAPVRGGSFNPWSGD